jgi:P4 family phage/plasmid primase-like protien
MDIYLDSRIKKGTLNLITKSTRPANQAEVLSRVLADLIRHGFTNDEIIFILKNHPVGEPLQKAEDPEKAIMGRIAHARSIVCQPDPVDPEAAPWLTPENAAEFNAEYGPFKTTRGRVWYRWNGQRLVEVDEIKMAQAVDRYLEALNYGKYRGKITKARRTEFIEKTMLLSEVYIGEGDNLNKYKHLLNFPNCLLDIETGQRREHDIKYLQTIQLGFDFDPAAQCPRWLRFMDEILPDDEGARDFLQEFVGYLLTPDTRHEVFVVLIGEGRNGKGVFQHVVVELLCRENVSFFKIDEIGQPHKGIHLAGKLANFSSENEAKIIQDTSMLKKISSGEPFEDSEKFKPRQTVYPFARLLFSTNNVLRFQDTSDGFRERLRMINFNQQFKGDKKDMGLKHYLVRNELPGILNWALEGLRRLNLRGHFVESALMAAAADETREGASSVFGFVRDRCVSGEPEMWDGRNRMYRAYVRYCELSGFKAHSNGRGFWADVKRAAPTVVLEDASEIMDGQLQRIVRGVMLREDL